MDPLEDLASAANQQSPYRRRMPAGRTQARRSSTPLVLAIILGSIIIGGAIIFLATRSRVPETPLTATDQPTAGQPQANDAANAEVKAQAANFKEFATRMADALGHQRKAALQSENTSSDLVITYTVQYLVKHLGTENAPNGRPITFLAQFAGSYDGKGEGYTSKDTCELNAGFAFDPSGHWKISSATERPLTHSTSGDFMGVPENGGAKRDIANIDWFNAAVSEAQKPTASK